jgi:hypothetical protein
MMAARKAPKGPGARRRGSGTAAIRPSVTGWTFALVKVSHPHAKKFDIHTGIGPLNLDAHQYDSFILIE